MGWKQFYRKTFESNWETGEYWGDFYPVELTVGDSVYYTVGYAANSPSPVKQSPRIQVPQGVKLRITVKYFFYADANTTGTASIGIMFYKDGDTVKNPDGHDFFGVSHSLSTELDAAFAEEHEMVMEYDGTNKLSWVIDGSYSDETVVEVPLISFVVAVTIDEVGGSLMNNVGILIYEVTAEYYDQWEDWINQINSIIQWMIPLMFAMMFIPLLVRLFRGEGKKEEERTR